MGEAVSRAGLESVASFAAFLDTLLEPLDLAVILHTGLSTVATRQC